MLGISYHYYYQGEYGKNRCQHPKPREYLEVFLKRFPTTNRDADFVIVTVDPEHWYFLMPKKRILSNVCPALRASQRT